MDSLRLQPEPISAYKLIMIFTDGRGSFMQYGTLPSRMLPEHTILGPEQVLCWHDSQSCGNMSTCDMLLQDPRPSQQLYFSKSGKGGGSGNGLSMDDVLGIRTAESASRSPKALRARHAVQVLSRVDAGHSVVTPVGSLRSAFPIDMRIRKTLIPHSRNLQAQTCFGGSGCVTWESPRSLKRVE